jgi:hypothetical protein
MRTAPRATSSAPRSDLTYQRQAGGQTIRRRNPRVMIVNHIALTAALGCRDQILKRARIVPV